MERIGFNAAFNAGAMKWNGKYLLAVRTEGNDRKSFFAIAESPNGIDNFRFWDRPITLPETNEPDTNVYDMRLTQHDDGYIYGVFCTERKDPNAPSGDTSSAVAAAGIARTKDLINWERLPDLVSSAGQQRNVVLFPHLINGKYAFFTIPGKEAWTVIINKQWKQHLATEYDEKEDVVRVKVKPKKTTHTERLQYFVEGGKGKEGKIAVAWEKVRIELPITVL